MLVRRYSKQATLSSLAKSLTDLKVEPTIKSKHPTKPARTRFAPSPTGFLHLGSLRTALYNYLLAKSTGGKFILRIEDTDRTRLVSGAEQNIFEVLKWCGLKLDEGPKSGGKYGPYRQSDRKEIYLKYANILLESGLAYKCYCSKERLTGLRISARRLKPPTTVTYDRECFDKRKRRVELPHVIRFKSPDKYPPFHDLLHGELNLQPQYNEKDRRYDDFVILKEDGMPTYHFANVIDDHFMKITHVVRGEEWLPSTPKHIALYNAFGWTPPEFIHIPLLTSLEDKKLSKRQGDLNIFELRDAGVLPEALINFVALFGWAPSRGLGEKFNEVMGMSDLIKNFSIDQLTKGNAKVDRSKLLYFNKMHIKRKFENNRELAELVDNHYPSFSMYSTEPRAYFTKLLKYMSSSLTTLNNLDEKIRTTYLHLYEKFDYSEFKVPCEDTKKILEFALKNGFEQTIDELTSTGIKKTDILKSYRFALVGNQPGMTIPQIMELLGDEEVEQKITRALEYL
ncbi:MSE1 Glutamate--tRNA ligase [Candida maltosa Xu316]